MRRLYGSHNSRFFAVRSPGEILLFKGDSMFLRHRLNDAQVGDILRLGNNGDIYFRSDHGVFLLRAERGATVEPLAAVSHLMAADSPARLGGFVANVDGREFCYEQIAPESRLSAKLFRLLGTPAAANQATATSHKLFLCNNATGQLLEVFTAFVDLRRQGTFQWTISPTFTYLVVAEADKKGGLHFQVVDIIEEAISSEFDMKVTDITNVMVNDRGTVLLELRRPGSEKLVLWTVNQERCLINIPPQGLLYHFGWDVVVFVIPSGPYLIVKRYDDTVADKIDLRPLSAFGLDYTLHFNERQDIDVVTFKDDQLKIQHTDLAQLPTDAKRWKMLADQRRLESEEAMVQDALVAAEVEKRRLEALEKSRRLAASVKPEPRGPVQSPRPIQPDLPFSTAPPISASRNLPSQLSLDTEPPARPAQLPLEVSSPEPPRAPEPPPVLEAARAAEPVPPPEPPRPALTELPFEPDGEPEFLPVPDTESDELEPEPEPELELEAPTPAPEPVAAPRSEKPAPPSTRNPQEIDEELERLRMHYIAGEIGREEYYRRKRELEEERNLAGGDSEGGQSQATPDMLSLDLDLDAPPEPSRPRQGRARGLPLMQGRRIELGSDDSGL